MCKSVKARAADIAVLFILILSTVVFSTVNAGQPEWKIIHAGEVLLVAGEMPRQKMSIVIKGDIIDRVKDGYLDAHSLGLNEPDVEIIELQDKFVLPGLMDAHVHLTLSERPAGQRNDVARLFRQLRTSERAAVDGTTHAYTTLMSGYTTVRDVGAGNANAIFAVRDAVNEGKIPGPRIYAAGVALSPTGGHGDSPKTAKVRGEKQSAGVCNGTDSCRERTRWQIREGAALIKLHATGGGSEEAGGYKIAPSFTQAEFEAIVETAHGLGRKVAAHGHGHRGINAALLAGVDSIEHGDGSNDETIKLFLKTGAFLVPTLSVLNDLQRRLDQIAETGESSPFKQRWERVIIDMPKTIGKMHKKGVKIAAGSDAALNPHGQNANELIWYVRIGMTPMEAIKSSTLNVAALIGNQDKAGSIEPGKWADIIAVDGRPLINIGDLKKVCFVMKGGTIYRK